jgi:hypothetical protein
MDDGLPVDESWEIHPSLIKPVGKEIGHGALKLFSRECFVDSTM